MKLYLYHTQLQDKSRPIEKGLVELLEENGMWPFNAASPKGKRIDNPILIEGVSSYVIMENMVINFMFQNKRHDLIIQGICEKDGRHIDCVLMKVSNYDGSDEHTEKVYFDITEGFNSL